MKPKEKALQLIEKMFEATFKDNRVYSFDLTLLKHLEKKGKGVRGFDSIERAKECAMICADEVFSLAVALKDFSEVEVVNISYWQEVKKEIELI